MAGLETVEIHYVRPPGRLTVFRQRLLERRDDCIVTFMERTPLRAPSLAGDRVILEPDAPVVWFTFPGAWHDIGRFHTAAGGFTGFYANLLSPVRFHGPLVWETTDLFLDVWLEPGGRAQLLDEDELAAAIAAGWVDGPTADAVRAEAARIVAAAAAGAWPPPVARSWTLERARGAIAAAAAGPGGTRGPGTV